MLVGAPFFQYEHERDFSVTDKVSKPYFKGSSSDVEAHDKNKSKRKESIDSFESKHDHNFLWKVLTALSVDLRARREGNVRILSQLARKRGAAALQVARTQL